MPLLFFSALLDAQVNVVRSEEKVIIAGTAYYIHVVKKGETAFSISRAYGITVDDIKRANPGAGEKLGEGDALRLPVSIVAKKPVTNTVSPGVAKDEQKYIYHVIKPGETIFSIARLHGVTESRILAANPGIEIKRLTVGAGIIVPGIEYIAGQQVQVPDADTLPVAAPCPRSTGFTPVRDLKGSLDVALLLPFYTRENSLRTYKDSVLVRGKSAIRYNRRPEEWIYRSSIGFIEMYEGILLAADTLASLGLDINLHVYDIKSDTLELARVIARGELDDIDLIIGPVYSANLAMVASFAMRSGIPVVSPVRLFNNRLLENNRLLFMANPTLEVIQDAIARKCSGYYDRNFIFIHSDSAGIDPDVRNFSGKITAELTSRLPAGDMLFREYLFHGGSVFNDDTVSNLAHLLVKDRENIIILASEDPLVVSETLQEIHALSKKFAVRVFGYPTILSDDEMDPRFIFDLDILFYIPCRIDYSKKNVKQFNADFRQKFFTQPSEMSYAWIGYDIMYYFLSGLAIHGNHFIRQPWIHCPELLGPGFDFRSVNKSDGFENQKLSPVRFTSDREIKPEPDENSSP